MSTYVWDRWNDKTRYTFGQTAKPTQGPPHSVGATVVVAYNGGISLLDMRHCARSCIPPNETVHDRSSQVSSLRALRYRSRVSLCMCCWALFMVSTKYVLYRTNASKSRNSLECPSEVILEILHTADQHINESTTYLTFLDLFYSNTKADKERVFLWI